MGPPLAQRLDRLRAPQTLREAAPYGLTGPLSGSSAQAFPAGPTSPQPCATTASRRPGPGKVARQAHGHTHTARNTIRQLITEILISSRNLSLDPPASSGGSFLARFLRQEGTPRKRSRRPIPTRELVVLDRARVPDRRPVLFRAGADRGADTAVRRGGDREERPLSADRADNRAVVERRVHPRRDDPAAAALPAVAAEPCQAE